ncbi:hypothetical protein LLG46_08140 [bacterium]|nr:hypothetical protein [bacterium]
MTKNAAKKNNEIPVVITPLNLDINGPYEMLTKWLGDIESKPIDILKALFRDDSPDIVKDIMQRNVELKEAADGVDVLIALEDKTVIEKLVMPLRSAKQAYCLADNLGCIALCGYACEMAAVFALTIAARSVDCTNLDDVCKFALNKKKCESWRQEQRIECLEKLQILPDLVTLEKMRDVKRIRNRYLHSISKCHSKIRQDAVACYVASSYVMKSMIHIGLHCDGLHIPDHLVGYLKGKKRSG